MNDLQQNCDEPYEVKLYNIELEEDQYLSNIREDTISFIEEKIKYYENKLESEHILRKYVENVNKNKHMKAKGYIMTALIIAIIDCFIYLCGHLYRYTAVESFGIGDLGSIGALLMYPSFFLFILGVIVCVIKAIGLEKDANIIVDPYSMKYKKWDYIIEESKERSKIYEKEVKRLEVLVGKMKYERDKKKSKN